MTTAIDKKTFVEDTEHTPSPVRQAKTHQKLLKVDDLKVFTQFSKLKYLECQQKVSEGLSVELINDKVTETVHKLIKRLLKMVPAGGVPDSGILNQIADSKSYNYGGSPLQPTSLKSSDLKLRLQQIEAQKMVRQSDSESEDNSAIEFPATNDQKRESTLFGGGNQLARLNDEMAQDMGQGPPEEFATRGEINKTSKGSFRRERGQAVSLSCPGSDNESQVSYYNQEQMLKKAEVFMNKGQEYLRRHSLVNKVISQGLGDGSEAKIEFSSEDEADKTTEEELSKVADFGTYLKTLITQLDKKREKLDVAMTQIDGHLELQKANQVKILEAETRASSELKELNRLSQENQQLVEKIHGVSRPVQSMVARSWTKIQRLASHTCAEKKFQAAFVPDAKYLAPIVFETWQKLTAFKYNPSPPVPEGVTRKQVAPSASSEEQADRYEGEIDVATEQRDGRGHVIYIKDGSFYEGYWRNDQPQGRGRRIFKNGDFYEGEFLAGMSSGYGRHMSNDNFLYEGYWKEDRYHGEGKLVYSTGIYIEGTFVEGKLNGQGKQIWNDGQRYTGEFKDGILDGSGRCFYPDGSNYDGFWVDNKKQGYGVLTNSDGVKQGGDWHEDAFVAAREAAPEKVIAQTPNNAQSIQFPGLPGRSNTMKPNPKNNSPLKKKRSLF